MTVNVVRPLLPKQPGIVREHRATAPIVDYLEKHALSRPADEPQGETVARKAGRPRGRPKGVYPADLYDCVYGVSSIVCTVEQYE